MKLKAREYRKGEEPVDRHTGQKVWDAVLTPGNTISIPLFPKEHEFGDFVVEINFCSDMTFSVFFHSPEHCDASGCHPQITGTMVKEKRARSSNDDLLRSDIAAFIMGPEGIRPVTLEELLGVLSEEEQRSGKPSKKGH